MLYITAEEMQRTLEQIFLKYQFRKDKAELLSKTYTASTVDGVNSHGINRVPLFLEYVEKDVVKIDNEASCVNQFGNIERWDGNQGPGIINATKCTKRTIELAKESGMGLLALRNTNHWMRGGTYGRMAADEGCIAIFFTNTQPNMPAWGGKYSRIGNNPLIIAIPRNEGHVVLDMAISQYAFGKINDYKIRGKKLPYPGGWDEEDQLSKDPEKITKTERGLPIGYWKGSALAMMIDMLTTLLAAGDSTSKIGQRPFEYNVSQVYLCIYPEIFGDADLQERLLNEIIDYTHDVEPMRPGQKTFFPGENTLETRKRNLEKGCPVSESVWDRILSYL